MPSFTAEDVKKAFIAIRKDGIPNGFGPSTRWDIIDNATGESFPPKAVLHLAKQFAADESHSGGGGDVGTNNALRGRGFYVILKPNQEKSPAAEDIENIIASKADSTTKKRLINARLGQGGFREALVEIWLGKCALTSLSVNAVLRASHIKAWRKSTDKERLDPANGVLLAANVDALFDRYLISFEDGGRLLVSSNLTRSSLEQIGIKPSSKININEESMLYMNDHRTDFFDITTNFYRF